MELLKEKSEETCMPCGKMLYAGDEMGGEEKGLLYMALGTNISSGGLVISV